MTGAREDIPFHDEPTEEPDTDVTDFVAKANTRGPLIATIVLVSGVGAVFVTIVLWLIVSMAKDMIGGC